MAQEFFIKKLLDRRVPQILGSYLVASTSLVLFVEIMNHINILMEYWHYG